ncbi:HDOD domain-containing protein [Rhodoferax saidenbachensis]|uniref:HD-like signal output (HDOD) protein n=1 Tax=Rhodoferax saidenbachensis TaxID=1484693 RepID=A0ABU1ZGW9_9BURK|nr:HDOD domain-containing protein [Rhodoferax saidenbachensis]MDR7304791.1 HD-like signal output (HDOD) protein [Rhodoferax saidenbachensis]
MRVADVDREIDAAKTDGPLRDIVIQPCPALLIDLRAEFSRPDPEPATIVAIASRDVAMAAALIKVANSAVYARSRAATTVADAVALLGIAHTVSILTGFLLRDAIRVSSPQLEHFWENSTRRAYAMGYIAGQMYGMNADVAHTCGLFCHVGLPILLQSLPGYDATLTEATDHMEHTFTDVENAAHRTDHAVVGAIVAKTWRLPPIVAIAVRLHHDFSVLDDARFPDEVRALVAMSLLAERLVVLHEGVQAHKEWEQHGAACLAHLRVSEAEMEQWQDALQPQFEGPAGF